MAIVAAVAFWAVVAGLLKWGRVESAREKTALAQLNALSVPEAMARAQTRLSDASLFNCARATVHGTAADALLPPAATNFFAQYDAVKTVKGPQARIARDLVAPVVGEADAFILGEGMVGSDVEYLLVVKAGQDEVFAVHAGEPIDPEFGVYTTVWHWVLATAEEAGDNCKP